MQGTQITQNETMERNCGLRIADCGINGPPNARVAHPHCQSAFRNPQSAMAPLRPGFTLTELLIVIAIIAVLAGLITAASVNALRAAKRARIVLEIKNISTALENFKNDYGSYPPNAMSLNNTHQSFIQANSDIERAFKKAFPRAKNEELRLMHAIAGQIPASSPSFSLTGDPLLNGLSASEALVFWLGGFSDDPQFPISGAGGPSFDFSQGEILEDRKQRYEFNRSLLVPRNDGGAFDVSSQRLVKYQIDLNGDNDTGDAGETRQINMWRFNPSGSKQSLMYFDCSRYKPVSPGFDLPAAPNVPVGQDVFAFKRLREGVTAATQMSDFIFVNQGKFQIIHCGLDDAWGDLGPSLSGGTISGVNDVPPPYLFPDGPFTGDKADTLTNFFDGELSDAETNK